MKRYAKKWCRRFPLFGAIFCIVCLFSLAIKLNFDIINHNDRSTLDAAADTKRVRIAYIAHRPIKTGSFLKKIDRIINYPSFVIHKPKFIDQKDEAAFLSSDLNIEALKDVSGSRLQGRIIFQKNASIHESFDCGWKTNLKDFEAYDVLKETSAYLVLFRPRNRIVQQILRKLNLSERIVYYDRAFYKVNYHINTCLTPPLHPILWQKARKKLIGSNYLNIPLENSCVTFIYSSGGELKRKIVNYQVIEAFLRERYQNVYSLSSDDLETLEKSLEILPKSRIIIGIHGSSMHSIQMATANATVIEYMPTTHDGAVIPRNVAHTIIWQTADMLQQSYWRLHEMPLNSYGDIRINVFKLQRTLEIVDAKYPPD
ncbi:DgyrCDS7529 [Dimorphilus gyrociliatus]|uniref:DgyrCDS7529 n=1 Tax=Dimorphilus gyrociliatus TaxID=2664684 RepID=A0A7I8VTV4_9ANNE|nr:DgyrCDS7529 [Dimorphilus gyrociliatus]